MAYDGVTVGSEQANMLAAQDAGLVGGGFMEGLKAMIPGIPGLPPLGLSMSSDARSSASGNGFDNSGWNVTFGGGNIESKASKSSVESWIYLAGAVVALIVGIKALKGKT